MQRTGFFVDREIARITNDLGIVISAIKTLAITLLGVTITTSVIFGYGYWAQRKKKRVAENTLENTREEYRTKLSENWCQRIEMKQLREQKEKLMKDEEQKASCSKHYVRAKLEQAAAPVLQELVTIHKEETETPPRDDHLDRDEQISIDSAPF